jgi:hypothetical protein
MKMEHRHSKRLNRDIQVTIAYSPLGIVNARMTNICPDGIQIDTGCIRLQVDQLVEVFFRQANGRIGSIKALTIYSTGQVSGLYFTEGESPRLLDEIQHPFYHAA